MFNLLPESIKKQITDEYKLRRILVILFALVVLEVISLVFVFPSWVVSDYKEKSSSAKAKQMESSTINSDINSIKSQIKTINSEMLLLDRFLEYPKVKKYLDVVLNKKTNSILINKFSYASLSTSTAIINIQGVSSTREALVSFKQNLTDSKTFKTVDLPVSNFTKDKNINFNLTMTVAM